MLIKPKFNNGDTYVYCVLTDAQKLCACQSTEFLHLGKHRIEFYVLRNAVKHFFYNKISVSSLLNFGLNIFL